MKKGKRRALLKVPALTLLSILVLTVTANLFSNYFLGTKFLINRTAIFYYPFFILTLVFLLNENNNKHTYLFTNGILGLFCFLSVFNFQKNLNVNSTINWSFEAPIPEVLDYINEKGKAEGKVYILDSTVMFQSSLNYYHWKKRYPNVVYAKDQPDHLDQSLADYFLHLKKPLEDVNYYPEKETVNLYPRQTVLNFEKEGVVLLSNLKKKK